jgi:hypothetical protein
MIGIQFQGRFWPFLIFFSIFQDISNLGGASLLERYKDSPSQLLVAVYPEYDWLPWKFSKTSSNYWNPETKREFLNWAGKQLGIREISDWNTVNISALRDMGYGEGSLSDLLTEAFPQFPWQFRSQSKTAQNKLATILKEMFPKEGVS